MAASVKSIGHDEVREWVVREGGHPAAVRGTGDHNAGVLRIDFGDPDEGLEQISWDEFFEKFDKENLALLHSTEDANRFNKLVRREE